MIKLELIQSLGKHCLPRKLISNSALAGFFFPFLSEGLKVKSHHDNINLSFPTDQAISLSLNLDAITAITSNFAELSNR